MKKRLYVLDGSSSGGYRPAIPPGYETEVTLLDAMADLSKCAIWQDLPEVGGVYIDLDSSDTERWYILRRKKKGTGEIS